MSPESDFGNEHGHSIINGVLRVACPGFEGGRC